MRQLLAVCLVFLFSVPTKAGPADFITDLFVPGQKSLSRIRYEYRGYENRFSSGKPFHLEQHRFEASTPLSVQEKTFWKASIFADYDGIGSEASIPSGRKVPNRLWDLGVGLAHSIDLENGKSAGGSLSVSSPSDRPYSAARNIGFSLNLLYKIPQPNENMWVLFLSASNTRGFLNYIPTPGAAYFWKAHQKLKLMLGVPFLLAIWQPLAPWTLTAFYFPIRTAELKISHGNPRGFQPYASVGYRTRNYWLSDRADSKERLFYDEGSALVGLSGPAMRGLYFDLNAGNAFSRRYYLAHKPTERKDSPGIVADNAFTFSAKLTSSF